MTFENLRREVNVLEGVRQWVPACRTGVGERPSPTVVSSQSINQSINLRLLMACQKCKPIHKILYIAWNRQICVALTTAAPLAPLQRLYQRVSTPAGPATLPSQPRWWFMTTACQRPRLRLQPTATGQLASSPPGDRPWQFMHINEGILRNAHSSPCHCNCDAARSGAAKNAELSEYEQVCEMWCDHLPFYVS